MATDPEKLKRWEAFITKEIAGRPKAKSTYVLLRSEQLVGTCLIMFMRNDIAKNITHVEASTKKVRVQLLTGFQAEEKSNVKLIGLLPIDWSQRNRW